MDALLDVILPVFLVIGFGYFAAYKSWFSENAVDGLMKFAQQFAIPCLLFKAIANLDLGQQFDLRLLASFYTGAISCFALGALGARYIFKRAPEDSVAIGFLGLFSNSLMLGLPITERAYGMDVLQHNYAIVSIHAPFCYGVGLMVMEIVRGRSSGAGFGKTSLSILKAMFSNALVIGIGLGFIVNLTHLPLPSVMWEAIDLMIRAALPTALFGLGAILWRYRPEGDMRVIAYACCLSLIVHPAITWSMARGLHLSTDQIRSAVLTSSMATGVNGYLFANMYGVAKRVAASTVLIATASSILTIWIWLSLLP